MAVEQNIPDIVIGRLPIYLRALTYLDQSGKTNTSSHELGRRLGISSAQIRKDLSHFGEFGKQGTGYNILYLIDQLRKILHLDREWRVAIIGAGFLGHALAHYQGFQHRGFQITWIFDTSPDVVGKQMNDITVQHLDQLAETAQRENIQMAIIAVPASAAQAVADNLVAAGVCSILSYAPINLSVPEGVQVQYSDPVTQMQHMAFYLQAELEPISAD
ncbi:MAG TPA: redox-sensing transcriptional repressor Rex [Anaerolineae bacterium]|nr:redox-sensing transcriptional repressor Rex [Anaerolineae bacterium]